MADDALADFDTEDVTLCGTTRRVHRLGSGPAVIVIAEMPGISPKVANVARRIAGAGATAVLPSLFGVDGRDPRPENLGAVGSATNMLGTIARACITREFTILATGKTSPVASWLRALAAREHDRCGGPGVGAVGMCFTGGFALAMATDDRMLAPVLSQPSLPFAVLPGRARAIDVSESDLALVQARCARGLEVMGLRFRGDRLVPEARFAHLRELLGDAFIGVELPDESANPDSMLPQPHSVLTEDLIDEPGQPTREAYDRVIDFFTEKLGLQAATRPPA
ncbi:dienelactone hydrolase family protein [Gordonia terrae]|uniref:Dienelactone hydrolase n=2 Tax=Gordonia terrae TaxID=2055 RepID=A0AAD0NY71_9ACTN|nr:MULTISPECIES: dienelactone hydrolase family protein [Gordonia]VTR09909.1 Dienelactone hydrolase family [Clostridioides difficile]ANY23027.1 dienelactone hydrolase [Gordonia terrae]AWO83755.1 dienelactone hydrolase [Gordonia terrae]UPW10973.1 dienelactone hydrolase family protein [Gordonia terrae]VTS46589.1 Dienelactone hydrolase family [Gordonia terrae]